jgi:hypothetical protein
MSAKQRKPFKCKVMWGETPTVLNEYGFATKAERDAFLFGINEADGWLGSDVATPEEADNYADWGEATATYAPIGASEIDNSD